METADEGREDVGVLGMVIVVGAVEVGGHDGDVVGAVLAVEVFAVLEARDLGEGVGFVGLLELGGEQTALGHGLGSHAGVDARGAEELELPAAVAPGGVDDVHLEHHVVIHEVGEGRLVGLDASDLGGGEEDVFGTLGGEEAVDGPLVSQVKLAVGAGDDVGVALAPELADYGRPYHAAVAGYVYLGCLFHRVFQSWGDQNVSLRRILTGMTSGSAGMVSTTRAR